MSFMIYKYYEYSEPDAEATGWAQFSFYSEDPSPLMQELIKDGALVFKGYADGCDVPIYDYSHIYSLGFLGDVTPDQHELRKKWSDARAEQGWDNHTMVQTLFKDDALFKDTTGETVDGGEPYETEGPVNVHRGGHEIVNATSVNGIAIEQFEKLFLKLHDSGSEPVADPCKAVADAGPVIGIKPFGQA